MATAKCKNCGKEMPIEFLAKMGGYCCPACYQAGRQRQRQLFIFRQGLQSHKSREESKTDARWDISEQISIMSLIVENVINQKEEGYDRYGSVQVSVRNTETGTVNTASVSYDTIKSEGEAMAEAMKEASDKF